MIGRLALEHEGGAANLGRHAGAQERRQITQRLRELAQLEVGLGQPQRRATSDRAGRIDPAGQFVLGPRFVAVAVGVVSLALDQEHPRAGGRRQGDGQQVLREAERNGGLAALDGAAGQAEASRQGKRRAARLKLVHVLGRAVPIGRRDGGQREAELGPVALGGRALGRCGSAEVRAKHRGGLGRLAGIAQRPSLPEQARDEQRVQPGLSEAHELARRIVRTAEPGEGLGVPEEDVALETRRGRPALRQIGPRLLRLVVLLERVKRQGQAVANPRVGGGRQSGLLEAPERVESTGTVAEAQCGEAAPKDGPRREIGGFAIGGDLTEEAIGFLEASEPIIGLAEPVPRINDQVGIAGAPQHLLQRSGRLVEFPLGEFRTAALERLRRDPEPRARTRQHSRCRHRGGRLARRRQHHRRRWQRRHVDGRGRRR